MMIGLVWRPSKPYPDLVYDDLTGNRERAVVDFRLGDSMLLRSPTHHEARRLKTLTDEPVIETRRIDGSREVYRSSLVVVRFQDARVLTSGKGSEKTATTARIIFTGRAQAPDLAKAQWRQVYEDIRADIENERLKPGDRIPTAERLGGMYSFSPTSVLKALQILQAEEWLEARGRVGRFVRFQRSRRASSDASRGKDRSLTKGL